MSAVGRAGACAVGVMGWLALWLGACAGVATGSSAPPPTAAGVAALAAALAPDLAARAQRADQDATRASTPAERNAHAQRARLLWDAALAEADRIVVERKIAAAELRIEAAVEQRRAMESARLAAERERERLEAAAAERGAAEQLFNALAAGMGRPNAAAFLVRRAQARLAGAIALGGQGASVSAAEAAIAAVNTAREDDQLHRAELALLTAERALGVARQREGEPDRNQVLDLVQRLRERGFLVELTEQGAHFRLPDAFAAGSREPRAVVLRRLQLLRDLLPAYPHGELRFVCASDATAASAHLARARAQYLVDFFARELDRARLRSDTPAATSETGELQLWLVAYRAIAL